ncbi:MAG: hypothetical protein AAF636_04325 [Pseudomonadota bacterium]
MSEHNADKIALDLLLERMSDHLDALAAKVFEIEDAIGKAIKNDCSKSHEGATITRLQSLDFLRQSLEDLALLSCYLSQNSQRITDGRMPANALSVNLKLDVTRAIVVGAAKGAVALHAEGDGDLDLF